MLRYLTERLPVMVTPRWVGTRIQPIAIRDVLRYLIAAARLPEGVNRTFDIGGPEVLTYREMMSRYAAVAELPARRVLPVPVLTPRLSSHWVNLVTPVPRAIAAPLIDSLVHEVVCREQDILEYVPDPPEGRIGYDRAVALALTKINTATWRRAGPTPRARRRRRPAAQRPAVGGRHRVRRRARASVHRGPRGAVVGRHRHRRCAGVGTRSRWPGRCAAGWTGWSAASGCAAAGATPTACTPATPSTGGGSSGWRTRTASTCCGCAPR